MATVSEDSLLRPAWYALGKVCSWPLDAMATATGGPQGLPCPENLCPWLLAEMIAMGAHRGLVSCYPLVRSHCPKIPVALALPSPQAGGTSLSSPSNSGAHGQRGGARRLHRGWSCAHLTGGCPRVCCSLARPQAWV